MDTTRPTHSNHHPRPVPVDPDGGHDAAVRWLARQLRWEHLLTELRRAGNDGATT